MLYFKSKLADLVKNTSSVQALKNTVRAFTISSFYIYFNFVSISMIKRNSGVTNGTIIDNSDQTGTRNHLAMDNSLNLKDQTGVFGKVPMPLFF